MKIFYSQRSYAILKTKSLMLIMLLNIFNVKIKCFKVVICSLINFNLYLNDY